MESNQIKRILPTNVPDDKIREHAAWVADQMEIRDKHTRGMLVYIMEAERLADKVAKDEDEWHTIRDMARIIAHEDD